MAKSIVIKGARVNNLKNVDLEIPRDKLVILTGLSGSTFFKLFTLAPFITIDFAIISPYF